MTSESAPVRPIGSSMWLLLAVLVFGSPATANAQSRPEAVPPDKADQPEDSGHLLLGGGVAAIPRFQGSDEYKIQPLPLIDLQIGRLFARIDDGIGVNVVETSAVTAGAGINWMQGYDGDDVPNGIGGVDDAVGARIFLSTEFRGTVATLAATQALTESDRGLVIEAELAYPMAATERLVITPRLGTSWANGKYMKDYFGIAPSEAAASGLSRHQPGNGFKDVSFRVSARYRITDGISALGSVGVTHLLDEAADSPLVEEKTQPLAFIGLAYRF